MLSTVPVSKFRGASFLNNHFKLRMRFQNAVYMPNRGRTENLNTVPCGKFRCASFWKNRSF